jgi:hypothetical protein
VLVLLDSTTRSADVKFVGPGSAGPGSADAGPLAGALRAAAYPVIWPDGAATKLVRRGLLRCGAGGPACELVLERPSDVRTIEPEP